MGLVVVLAEAQGANLTVRAADGGPLITREYDLPVTRFNRPTEAYDGGGNSNVKRYRDLPTKAWDMWRLAATFDWFIDSIHAGFKAGIKPGPYYRFNINRTGYPRTLWCRLGEIDECFKLLEHVQEPDPAGRVVVFIGQDRPLLSEDAVVRSKLYKLRRWFEGIRYESKDVHDPRVGTAIMGLSEHYYRGHEQAMFDAINSAKTSDKAQLAFGAWGEFWKQLDESAPRMRLERWIKNNTWVPRIHVERRLWYPTIASSKFLVQPLGNSLQTPKLVEALLVLTIPVVEAAVCHVDLRNEGWPIVVVTDWGDVTPDFLEQQWTELEPRLAGFRRDVLFGDGFFRYLTSVPTSF